MPPKKKEGGKKGKGKAPEFTPEDIDAFLKVVDDELMVYIFFPEQSLHDQQTNKGVQEVLLRGRVARL